MKNCRKTKIPKKGGKQGENDVLFVANALVFKKRREKCLFYQELERVLQQVKTADFQRIYEMI
jgi:hypothetical protein